MLDRLRSFIFALAVFAIALLVYTLIRNTQQKQASALVKEPFTAPSTGNLHNGDVPALSRLDEDYTKLAAKVLPSVVSVNTTSVVQRYQSFGPFLLPSTPEAQKGIGSGAIISREGHIITNYHVIEGAQEVNVTTQDNKVFKARVINGSKTRDIALLKIESARQDFPALSFADSDKTRVGQVVFAVGNPFGLSGTVTQGIISARDRHLSDGGNDYLQTDTVINPGNSGGPLVNIRGEILGVNVAIYRGDQHVQAWQGVGLAVPANQARQVVETVLALANGKIKPKQASGYLGITLSEGLLTVRAADGRVLRGVLVYMINAASPAAAAGLHAGDVIVGMQGQPIKDAAALLAQIRSLVPGTQIKLEVLRGESFYAVDATVSAQPQ
ncbi:MAG: S1C family serine protease [Verrucomicrobiaceae bacterium]